MAAVAVLCCPANHSAHAHKRVLPYFTHLCSPSHSLCEDFINTGCDIRQATEGLMLGAPPVPPPYTGKEGGKARRTGGGGAGNRVLLIDEVDVFFSQSFYGARCAAARVSLLPCLYRRCVQLFMPGFLPHVVHLRHAPNKLQCVVLGARCVRCERTNPLSTPT